MSISSRGGTPVFGSSCAVPPQKLVALFSVRVGCSVASKFRMDTNSLEWKRATASSLVPFQPFQLGRNQPRHALSTSSSKIFRQGGNAWNLLDFDDQSAAIVCVGSIKYYSIPSVPSRLEGVKTRPQPGVCVRCCFFPISYTFENNTSFPDRAQSRIFPPNRIYFKSFHKKKVDLNRFDSKYYTFFVNTGP